MLTRLMESQIWYQLARSVVGRGVGLVFRKETRPLLALMPDDSVSPYIPLVLFKLLPRYWSSEVGESMCGFF